VERQTREQHRIMKTKFCKPNYGMKIEKLRATRLQLCPPPIPFVRKDDPNAKVIDEDESKVKKKTFTLRHDPNDKESRTYEYTISIFEDGDPESFIRWIIEVEQEILPNLRKESTQSGATCLEATRMHTDGRRVTLDRNSNLSLEKGM
jgi:hypothetical protein